MSFRAAGAEAGHRSLRTRLGAAGCNHACLVGAKDFNWHLLTGVSDKILRHIISLFANDVSRQNWFDARF